MPRISVSVIGAERLVTQLLLTEAEAAERLRLCPRTLRKARHAGELHYVLIGRAVRYTVADLESYIETLRQKVPAACLQPTPLPNTRKGRSKRNRAPGVIIPFTARAASR